MHSLKKRKNKGAQSTNVGSNFKVVVQSILKNQDVFLGKTSIPVVTIKRKKEAPTLVCLWRVAGGLIMKHITQQNLVSTQPMGSVKIKCRSKEERKISVFATFPRGTWNYGFVECGKMKGWKKSLYFLFLSVGEGVLHKHAINLSTILQNQ